MIIKLNLVVSLKITDVVAHTAYNALTRRQGYTALESLSREDLYQLEVEAADEADALAFGHRVVAETSCFVNPNKHRYSLTAGTLHGADEARRVRLLVEWLEDGTAALLTDSLHQDPRFGGRIKSVRRGTLWTLAFKADFTGDARGMALDIAVARDAKRGLLANPHSQRASIL